MKEEKLLICVPCHNRKAITRLSLETLVASKAPQDVIVGFNDGSTEYNGAWLSLFTDLVFNTSRPIGVHAQRRLHMELANAFFNKAEGYTRLYLTDNDCLHDLRWRENLLRIQDKCGGALTCGYDTTAHSCLEGNTWKDDPKEEVIWRKYAPGVSYLMTPDHVEVIAGRLKLLDFQPWDWLFPDLLGNRCAISRVGYVDHIGFGGERHPGHEGYDGGDRVKAPTPFLQQKRASVIAELQKYDAAREADRRRNEG